MKFSQLIEYNKKTILFKNHGENEVVKLVAELFLLFIKPLYE